MKKYTQFLKSLLTDKYVLYLALATSISQLFVYMAMKEYEAVVFFGIIGFLTSFFSKNMIIILLVSMSATFLAIAIKIYSKVREGLEGMKPNSKKNKSKTGGKKNKKEHMQDLEPARVDGADDIEVSDEVSEGVASSKPKIDYASTLESAYDNLDKLLSSDAIKKMTGDTERLASKQQNLIGNINKLQPMMDKAQGMLEGLNSQGGLDGIASTIMKMTSAVNGTSKAEVPGKDDKGTTDTTKVPTK
jgi:hypothetical protein